MGTADGVPGIVLALESATGQWIGRADSLRASELRKAWCWKLDGEQYASSFEPPHEAGISDVVDPNGVARVTKTANVRILKDTAGEQRIVLGIVLEPEVVDSQGDVYSADEIARAAHGWMASYLNVGYQHQTLAKDVEPVESYICPVDCEIGGQPVKAGTWLLAIHITNDAIWKQIKAGALTGLSIGGWAQKIPAQQVDGVPIEQVVAQ